jgi:2-polyprenyl-6-methoxyphenol hydroxylase-like FAD-dependent oxidoreductase
VIRDAVQHQVFLGGEVPGPRGVAVRIVDRAPEFPGVPAIRGLSPHSLEVFDDLAVIDRMLASGITHLPHRKYRGAEVIAEIDPEAGQGPDKCRRRTSRTRPA